jgi:ribonuclease HI
MGKSKNKYFVVWDGIEPGIYPSWEECKKQIHGYAGAKYKGFETEAEARDAMCSPYWDFVGKKSKEKKPNPELIAQYGMPVMESIAVDAACSGNPGAMEYQGVDTRTGERIFHQGPFQDATNNVGEFLALVHAIALLKQTNDPRPVYSDSRTAMAWVRNKKVKTELQPTSRNALVFEMIERALKWLLNNDYSTEIMKWHTEAWGEIPADFGRK